jgi:orotate phosphoribosyltransferase
VAIREELEQLRVAMGVCIKRDGPYTLASGRTSHYYYNGKLGTLDPAIAWQVGNLLAEPVLASGAEAVGGLELGSIPLSDAIGIAAHLNGSRLPTFIVRKQAKDHGTQVLVEQPNIADGPLLRPGRPVAIVDDTITTGGSIRQAVEVVQGLGCEVKIIVALVERHENQGVALRDLGVPVWTLFHTDEQGTLFVDEGFVALAEGVRQRRN